jgi:hypothetical protein
MDRNLGPVARLSFPVGACLSLPEILKLPPLLALHTPSTLYLCFSGLFIGGKQSSFLMECFVPPCIYLVSASIDSARFHTGSGCNPGEAPLDHHKH